MQTAIDAGRIDIEKMRADIEATTRKAATDAKWETRKFVASLLVGSAALLGAGTAAGNDLAHRTPEPQPAPQIIYIVPSQAPPATTPARTR